MRVPRPKWKSRSETPAKPGIAIIGTRGLPASYGGFETSAEKTASRWVRDGHDVVVYCRKNHYPEYAETDSYPTSHLGVRLRYVPSFDKSGLGTPTASLYAIVHLLIFERKAQYIHLYNNINAPFVPLLRIARRRVLLSADGIEWKRAKWGRIQKFAHLFGEWCATHLGATVVADNESVAQYYRDKHDIEPTVIAYGADSLGIDPDLADEVLNTHDLKADGYFIFVGRVVKEKGLHNLIDAYQTLQTDKPLVIVGDSEASEYRDQIFANGCSDIRFLGYQYGTDYEQLLVNASMYVSASDLEGTSPSLLAAMAAGVCSLVQAIPENKATVGDSIELYAIGEVSDLAARWQRLADDPDRAAKTAERGLTHIANHYQWDAISNAYLDAWADKKPTGPVIDLRDKPSVEHGDQTESSTGSRRSS